jgi:hypothetical protein
LKFLVQQANPATVPGFAGAEAICNPVTTTGNPTMGSTAFAADGAINQLGAATIIQNPPACSIPQGFSAGGKSILLIRLLIRTMLVSWKLLLGILTVPRRIAT